MTPDDAGRTGPEDRLGRDAPGLAPGGSPAGGGPFLFRRPVPADLVTCADIWHEAVSDYLAALATQAPPLVPEPFLQLLGHLLGTDPERFLVAEDGAARDGRLLGFGSAIQREDVWFLAMLFVRPEAQGRGLGRALLGRILPGPGVAGAVDDASGTAERDGRARTRQDPGASTVTRSRRHGVLATCTDSAQPISNGLYARLGIVPRLPILDLAGYPDPAALPDLPGAIRDVRFGDAPGGPDGLDAALAELDRDVLGFARPEDHRHLRRTGRDGHLFLGPGGEALAYGYASPVGRIGPVAVADPTLTAPVLGHLVGTIHPRGASTCWVPGVNDRAVVALLRAGLRIDGFPSLLCSTRPFGAFDRYLPASLAFL